MVPLCARETLPGITEQGYTSIAPDTTWAIFAFLLCMHCSDANKNVMALRILPAAEAQTAEIRRIESDLTQSKQMVRFLCRRVLSCHPSLAASQINSMQLEVRSLAEPLRSQLGTVIRTYQSSLSMSGVRA